MHLLRVCIAFATVSIVAGSVAVGADTPTTATTATENYTPNFDYTVDTFDCSPAHGTSKPSSCWDHEDGVYANGGWSGSATESISGSCRNNGRELDAGTTVTFLF